MVNVIHKCFNQGVFWVRVDEWFRFRTPFIENGARSVNQSQRLEKTRQSLTKLDTQLKDYLLECLCSLLLLFHLAITGDRFHNLFSVCNYQKSVLGEA